MSTNATTPISFAGQSKFAASLQQVIARAVGIASLPLASDRATLTTLNARQAALQGLDADFSNLQSSVAFLQVALQFDSLSSSVSDGGVVKANSGIGLSAGTYSIHVDNLGEYSTALSNPGAVAVTDPTVQGISASASLTLSVGGNAVTITPATTSLRDLATAINTQSGGQVQATVVNVGSNQAPDYRLSLTAEKLGAVAIDLTDGSGSLISESHAGSLATYEVGGSATQLTSDSRTVTLAPGLTVDLLGVSPSSAFATIAVRNDPSSLISAFNGFARAYNQAVGDLAQYHGKDGGVLTGDSIVSTLSTVLHQISGYSNGTPETSLANFGIGVDANGILSLDSKKFTDAAKADFAGLAATLGGTATGGFLKAATTALNSVNDFATGLLKVQEKTLGAQIRAQNAEIASEQAKITLLQANLTQQIVKADAAISALESQLSYVNGLFHSITGGNKSNDNSF